MKSINAEEILSKVILEPGDSISILDENEKVKYWTASQISSKLKMLVGLSFRDYVHPQDQLRVKEILATAFTKKSIIIPQYRLKNLNGEYRWVETHIENMLENTNIKGYILKTRDITEKLADITGSRSRSYYDSLFHNHPDAVFRVDFEGEIRDINNAAVKIFGFAKEEGIGRNLFEFVLPTETEKIKTAFSKAKNGEAATYQTLALHKDGSELALNVTLVPIIINGKVTRIHGIAQDITQIHLANSLIKRQADIQSSIFESLSEGFFSLDENWCYTYLNNVCADFLQRNKEDLLNKNIFKCFPHLRTSAFKKNCDEVVLTGKSVVFYECYPKRKATIKFTIKKTAFGLAIHFTDDTEKLVNEENIHKLSMIASKITNGVILLDESKSVQWTNGSFTQITGYSDRYVLGRHLDNLFPSDSLLNKRSYLRILAMIKSSKPFSEDIHVLTAKGNKVWLTCSISPVIEEGPNPKYYIIVLTDITSRKEAEIDLLTQAEDLFKQNRDLGQFTYIVSHNIRSPIATALGCSELLFSLDKNDADFDELLTGLNQSIIKLDKVVKDLNTVLSVRNRAEKEIKEPVKLLDKCIEVYEDVKEILKFTSAEFSIDIKEEYLLYINSAYIYSILYNLITNAIKYRAPDRILAIKISAVTNNNKELALTISDNGIGIDMEKAKGKLFQLYSRLNVDVTGDGIGLFLVKTQVEALGGRLEVNSKLNEGTSFQIYLKLD